MRVLNITVGMAVVLGLALGPLEAASNGPKAPASVKASSPKAPKSANTPKAPKVSKAPTVASAKTTGGHTTKAPKAPKAEAHLAKADAKLKSAKKGEANLATSSTSTSGTTSSTGAPTSSTTVDFTKGAVAERLAKNANLRTKVESRLRAAGYEGSVYQAAYGFKNQGQFIAATNVSRNTGVSFEQLKLQMTGYSINPDGVVLKANLGSDGKITMVDPSKVTNPAPIQSLGQAVHTVNPVVDSTAAAQTATSQADAEIAATSTVHQ